MSFAKTYGDILEPFIKEYKDASNEKGRKTVLNNAVNALKEGRNLVEDGGVDLPKDLQTVWFPF
jgi:hypothetical protein